MNIFVLGDTPEACAIDQCDSRSQDGVESPSCWWLPGAKPAGGPTTTTHASVDPSIERQL